MSVLLIIDTEDIKQINTKDVKQINTKDYTYYL